MIDLRAIPLFSSLSPAGFESLASRLRLRSYSSGTTILSAGDPPSDVHILVNGTVRIITGARPRGLVLAAPQTLGEMSVVTGSSVSATVVANSDVSTLSLSASDLLILLGTEPSVGRWITATVIERLRHRTRSAEARDSAAVIVVTSGVTDEVAACCARAIGAGILHYAPASQCFGGPGNDFGSGGTTNAAMERARSWRRQGAGGQFLVLHVGPSAANALSAELTVDDSMIELRRNRSSAVAGTCTLPSGATQREVLVGDEPSSESAAHWLVRISNQEARQAAARTIGWDRRALPVLDRLARSLTRREVGVALSVGAAAGMVQMGFLETLESAGVPLDYVCGSSMGGIVAGLCGRFPTVSAAASDMARHATAIANQRRRLQWLLRAGMVSERWADRLSEAAFGASSFADLRFPVAVVAADLVAGERVIFEHGLLAPAMRATSAIPGIFPPVKVGNRILVDGGLVTRVPVDLLVQRQSGLKIAALVRPERDLGAEATHRRAEELHRSFQAIFGIRAVLGQSWRMLGWWDSAAQARQADIVVELPVPVQDGFNFGAVDRLVDLGRRLAEPHMPSIRQAFYEMIRPGSP